MFAQLDYHAQNSFGQQLKSLTLLLIISGILSGLVISAHIAITKDFDSDALLLLGFYNPVPGIVFGLVYGYTQFVGGRKIIFAVVSTLIYLLSVQAFVSLALHLGGSLYDNDIVCTNISIGCIVFKNVATSSAMFSGFAPSSFVAGGLGGLLLSATVLLLMKRWKYISLIIMTIVGAAAGFGFVLLYSLARTKDFSVALLLLAYTLWQVAVGLTLKITTTKDKSHDLQPS